jgi:hypothetical protein
VVNNYIRVLSGVWGMIRRRTGRHEPYQLRHWGDFTAKHMEHADEWGENILYGAGLLQGRVQDASASGSKILCADTPRSIQVVDIAVNTLPPFEMRAIRAWYCATPREDGRLWTESQVAVKLRSSTTAFESALKSAERKVLRLIAV